MKIEQVPVGMVVDLTRLTRTIGPFTHACIEEAIWLCLSD